MRPPEPSFDHLRRLTDVGGLYEHALGTTPRVDHGYCVDDVARGLVVTCREPGVAVQDLREEYLAFILTSQDRGGRVRNRRGSHLRWESPPSVEDCWGRALWGLGTAAVCPDARSWRARALNAFELSASRRSPWPRAMAFAALGASEVLTQHPAHLQARALLTDAARMIGRPAADPRWPWPEPRLRYANAVLPEALLAAGAGLDDAGLVQDGLLLLGWLLELQTRDGRLSLVPSGGRGPADTGPEFDQQPIEAAALADACSRAFRLTGDPVWAAGIDLAVAWFLGHNDARVPLIDVVSGGCCDGLEPGSRNENQGAESTLALLSTLQHARLRPEPAGAASGTADRVVQ